MNKRIKDRWIKALKSGKYKKGTRKLRSTNDEYCCLGVLCDLFINSKAGKDVNARWFKDLNGYMVITNNSHTSLSYPSQDIVDWAGLDNSNPEIKTCDREVTCSDINDEYCPRNKKGFGYIADLIKKNL